MVHVCGTVIWLPKYLLTMYHKCQWQMSMGVIMTLTTFYFVVLIEFVKLSLITVLIVDECVGYTG